MSPVTEFAIFNTTAAYRADNDILDAGFAFLAKADGLQRTFHGLQVEDGHNGYVVNVWETVGHHSNFITNESYGPMIETMQPAFVGAVYDFHVQFTVDPTPILCAPCTKITAITPNSRENKSQVLQILDKISQTNPSVVTYGEIIEDTSVIVMICAVTFDEYNIEHLTMLLSPLADCTVKHTKLRLYSE